MNTRRLGSTIKKIRKTKGITQKELADLVGICRASVIALEKGRELPKYDKMMRIQKFLKVKASL